MLIGNRSAYKTGVGTEALFVSWKSCGTREAACTCAGEKAQISEARSIFKQTCVVLQYCKPLSSQPSILLISLNHFDVLVPSHICKRLITSFFQQ